MITIGKQRKGIIMEKNKTETLKECFNMLDAEFGDKLTDQTRIFKKELFKKVIGIYPANKIQEMTIEIIRTRKYSNFPRIGEMVEIIEGNKEEETELAWMYLLEKIEQEGYYKSVAFPKYPAVGAVIENMGGWLRFLESMTEEQEKWIKKEFIRIYHLVKKRGDYPKYLPGYFELTNNSKGYENSKMLERYGMTLDGKKVKITEQKKIQEVIQDVKQIENKQKI